MIFLEIPLELSLKSKNIWRRNLLWIIINISFRNIFLWKYSGPKNIFDNFKIFFGVLGMNGFTFKQLYIMSYNTYNAGKI